MMERLEKFEAPPTPWHLFPGGVMILIALVACKLDFAAEETNAKVIAESQQAVASERAIPLHLSHPLGCPEKDETGRTLKATLSIKGERRPRCYYGSAL